MNSIQLMSLSAAAFAMATAGAHAAGYLKVGDIKGESQAAGDDKHDKWIDVLSAEWGEESEGRHSATLTIKEGDDAVRIGLLLPAVQKVRAASSSSSSGAAATMTAKMVDAPDMTHAETMTYRETGRGGRVVKTWVLHDVEYQRPRAKGRARARHTLNLTYSCKDWTDAAGNAGSDCAQTTGGNAETTWKVEKGEK